MRSRTLSAVQMALFLAALCIVTLEPTAERSFSTVPADEDRNDVGMAVVPMDIFTEPPDAMLSLMPDVTACSLAQIVRPRFFIQPIDQDRTHHQALQAHLIASIFCTSDL